MKVFNTLTNQKEEFVPINDKKVKMYVCGPTVYDFIHIGNARPYVIFDTVRRYLEHKGYTVEYAQNFTDIDDKIIKKAQQENVSVSEISNRYIDEALKDAKALNVKAPTFIPKVTEEISGIIDMIQILITQKNAYEHEGTVFFDTSTFDDYGKLSGKDITELEFGSRVEIDNAKKDGTDFVLWKPKKDGEPAWDSPWGEGRPGWHIECSVMIKKYLGEEIDIHAGGEDLIFPHHENEIAQSECSNHKKLARYWLHNGFINVDNEKMSKSKGNFFTIRDIAKEIPYDVIRFFILCGHYKAPINFSKEAMESSKKGLDRIKNCVKNINYLLDTNKVDSMTSQEKLSTILDDINIYKIKFEQEMDNDFNTANAITCIFEIVRLINSHVSDASSKQMLKSLQDEIIDICSVLAILYKTERTEDIKITDDQIDELVTKRTEAKKNKDYQLADDIRKNLEKKGVIIQDTSAGVRWSRS